MSWLLKELLFNSATNLVNLYANLQIIKSLSPYIFIFTWTTDEVRGPIIFLANVSTNFQEPFCLSCCPNISTDGKINIMSAQCGQESVPQNGWRNYLQKGKKYLFPTGSYCTVDACPSVLRIIADFLGL